MRIRFDNVSKRYGSVLALDQLRLEAEEGKLLVLLGPSGCGKTTCLRLVAGLEEITAGELYIGDRRVNHLPPQHRDVAMVFQNYALYPHMTVAENIAYPLLVRKRPKTEIAREVRRVAEMLEIPLLLPRRPRELSGGQQQRVALARAIIRHPVAFLLDEPLSNLDANLRSHMRTELKSLQQQLGTTTLYVTHDHSEAMTLADRIALLREGRLQQLGTPTELYRRPANQFVAGFLGTPSMNFLTGTVVGGSFRFSAGAIPLNSEQAQAAAGVEKVVLGFRPQEVSTTSPAGLRGRVCLTEDMGNETFAVLWCGSQKITARVPADSQLAAGDAAQVLVPPSSVHLFDAASGRTLLASPGSGRCP